MLTKVKTDLDSWTSLTPELLDIVVALITSTIQNGVPPLIKQIFLAAIKSPEPKVDFPHDELCTVTQLYEL